MTDLSKTADADTFESQSCNKANCLIVVQTMEVPCALNGHPAAARALRTVAETACLHVFTNSCQNLESRDGKCPSCQ